LTVLDDVTAVILAGGQGTRLRSVVADRNKVLALVNDRPFITYLFDQVLAAGIRRVILCIGYKAEQLRKELGEHYRGLRVEYSVEDQPLGTGGALALAARACKTANLISMNGDSYFDVELEELWQWHQSKRAAATIQLAELPDISRFGSVTLDSESRIVRFEEKCQSSGTGLINAGIYCMCRDFFEGVKAGCRVSMERELFPSLVARGLFGRPGSGRFIDIGTPESYSAANAFFLALKHGEGAS
jgi:NDP-sugar pyrophosphorylase family protein